MPEENGHRTLFDVPAQVPDGFNYRQNFISAAEEQELMRQIQKVRLSRLSIINLLGSEEQRALDGSMNSAQVKSQRRQRCRHFFYRCGHVPEMPLILIPTV